MALAKDCKVIYVEDDLQTQRAMGEILNSFFGHVYIASNGEEGLNLFENHKVDLIISDINMPKMNGIEMVTAIRSVDAEIPIMIISAYNDKEYLLDSIYLGIDRYVTKPLKDDEFFKNLHVILKTIHQKREALEYQKERIRNQINETALQTLKDTTDIYPSPTFVFKANGELEFMNSAASKIFSEEELTCLLDGECLNKFIIPRSGYLKNIEEVQNPSNNGKKLILKTAGGVRIFLVTCTAINSQISSLEAVSLTDITRVEYEKQKSQNLSAYLHDLLRSMRRNMVSDIAKEVAQKEQRQMDTPLPETIVISPLAQPQIGEPKEEEKQEKSYDYIRLSAMHPTNKESAGDYVASLSNEVVDELDEMEELEGEMKEILVEMEEHFSLSSVHSLAGIYARYGRMIALLMDFEDVSYSILNLSEFLLTLGTTEWNQKKMFILLQSICEDLMQWRQMIFVNQEANDIHYLDASLLSSCLQIKMDFGESKEESEENELELF
jgi:YesN/AraC family two-component response regulator